MGSVYPLTDFLGGDKTADIAVFKVAGSGFTPLPVATTPADVIGEPDRGRIEPGARADFVALDDELRAVTTWIGGEVAYQR